ncbi:Winged helix DNA-binding domain protein [Tepidimonas sediminis]|uniref:Winged helix DNA-binding domain protein n=1 Tax=Tepidimonas sediminis TaxID=2588941 RepID=A0A554WQI3_9BURK|nr:winged helix DNA-binding protein [Tepidimonas sediminis]TSE25825.1 Winged helix DNA-binding domain protein [Tepidimonas sediminis]
MTRARLSARPSSRADAAAPLPTVEPPSPDRPIVSSAHLVSEKSPELSEFEFGLIIAAHAFNRWLIRCMGAAGVKDMTPTDVLVLHHINHRRTPKRLADIAFVLNIEDAHVVSYSVRKLQGMGLVAGTKRGKEVFYATTDAGHALCLRYRAVREACLMPGFSGEPEENRRLAEVARTLRQLSGRYDQAARAATAY